MSSRESSEDYLETILVIRRLRGFCRNVDIAEHMGVAKSSVTKALSNLGAAGPVRMFGHDVRLTGEGERAASATLERHRFFERLLVESDVDAETASAEADAWSAACQRAPADVSRPISGADETRAKAGKRRAACRPGWATGPASDTAH